jgi:hypothetical protein
VFTCGRGLRIARDQRELFVDLTAKKEQARSTELIAPVLTDEPLRHNYLWSRESRSLPPLVRVYPVGLLVVLVVALLIALQVTLTVLLLILVFVAEVGVITPVCILVVTSLGGARALSLIPVFQTIVLSILNAGLKGLIVVAAPLITPILRVVAVLVVIAVLVAIVPVLVVIVLVVVVVPVVVLPILVLALVLPPVMVVL